MGMPWGTEKPFDVLSLDRGSVALRARPGASDVRPGGTLAGPFLFGLADLAIYAAVMSEVGEVPLAVTTDATIHFLRLPRVEPLVVRARVLKPGKRLVIAEATLEHESETNAPVAHAVMTYSVPPP